MAKSLIIAHDLGTSGDKASLYNIDGKLVDSIVSSYGTKTPKRGWAEQNPEDWWHAVCISTRLLMRGRLITDVAGISFSGQSLGCVCIDRKGKLLMNSIIWADMRATKENEALERSLG